MLRHSNSGPLKVALLTISPHNRAILEFFFAGAGRSLFKVTGMQEAEAFIVDYDHPGAREDWDKHANSSHPGIILSVHQVDLPNTVWIPKPLTSKALTEAVNRVRELAPAAEEGPQARPAVPSPVMERPLVQPQERLFQTPSPQPFGVSSRPVRKLRSLVISLDDEDEDEAPPPLAPKHEEARQDSEPQTVFDPAETDIKLDEIDRPVESTISQEEAEHRWKALCGEAQDVKDSAAAVLYTPENYILTTLLEAWRLAQQSRQTVQVTLSSRHYALFLADSGHAYSSLDMHGDEFAQLCATPVQSGQAAMHIPNSGERLQLEEQANSDSQKLYDLEAFLWTASLLTAQGRLSRHVSINQKVALKHWPNLTRLEQFPHIMRIAALWNQRPGAIFDIAKALNVPQRYVFSFYTAANTLNLFEHDQTKLKNREKEQPKQSRGLFSRLLKRLLGGGAK